MQAILRGASLLLLWVGVTLPLASVQADDESSYSMGRGMMWGAGPGGPCPYGDGRMGPGARGYGPGGWGGMGPGMMWGAGPGGMGMMGMGALQRLNLTDEQRGKIEKIQDAEHKKHLDVAGKMFDQQTKLRDLTQEDKPDPKKVSAAYGEVAKLHQQMLEVHVQAFNQVQDVLTKEQRDQLKQWRRGGYGPGYGPRGPGAGPGPR